MQALGLPQGSGLICQQDSEYRGAPLNDIKAGNSCISSGPDQIAWSRTVSARSALQLRVASSQKHQHFRMHGSGADVGVIASVLNVPAGPGQGEEERKQQLVKPASLQGRLTEQEFASFKSAEQRIFESVVKEAAAEEKDQQKRMSLLSLQQASAFPVSQELLNEGYERCGEVCAEYAKTFYLGTKLMTPDRQRAIWAIYVWCRRTDELVDGPNAPRITPTALDRWEERLEDIFAGQPYDIMDAALSDTVSKYPVSIKPFRHMIEGMRMDLFKDRYESFDDLYIYCYNVAGTVGLMSVPVMGIDKDSRANVDDVYNAALALGIANQLTNILRDVGEDARRGRIYLPQDELAQFGLTDADIFKGEVTEKWRAFMRFQIKRAREYFVRAEAGVPELDKNSRWPVWASLSLYQQILDAVEANDYNNFQKRAYVRKWRKFASLPSAFLRAQLLTPAATRNNAQPSLPLA